MALITMKKYPPLPKEIEESIRYIFIRKDLRALLNYVNLCMIWASDVGLATKSRKSPRTNPFKKHGKL